MASGWFGTQPYQGLTSLGPHKWGDHIQVLCARAHKTWETRSSGSVEGAVSNRDRYSDPYSDCTSHGARVRHPQCAIGWNELAGKSDSGWNGTQSEGAFRTLEN